MSKTLSIKKSILITVTSALLTLAFALIVILSIHEKQSVQAATRTLALEQIALTASKLDVYSLENQIKHITNTLYNLNKISGVIIFDKNCQVLNKKPKNINLSFNCKDTVKDDYVIYNSSSSSSDSVGSPKYILAQVDFDKVSIFDRIGLTVILFSLLLIFVTILALNYLFKARVLKSLDYLKLVINEPGALSTQYKNRSNLPSELQPIFDDVLIRDEIINQRNIELIKNNEEKIKNEMRQEFIHNIRSPLTIVRDYIFANEIHGDKKQTYLAAFNDLESLSKQLYSENTSIINEANLSSLMEGIIKAKNLEYSNSEPKVLLNLNSQAPEAKIKANLIDLKSAFSNLINNAKESALKNKDCSISISIIESDKQYIISIEDNGKGIKKEIAKKVFNKGASFNKPGGQGLGLYHAKKIIERAKGSVSINSQDSTGTTVEVSLPKYASTFLSHGAKPFKNIMIEDYALNQYIWHEVAIERNMSFAIFSSPAEFLKKIESVDKNANIYVDSHFPDFHEKGEDWSKVLSKKGFSNIYLCSTNNISTHDKAWIKSQALKNKPFTIC